MNAHQIEIQHMSQRKSVQKEGLEEIRKVDSEMRIAVQEKDEFRKRNKGNAHYITEKQGIESMALLG